MLAIQTWSFLGILVGLVVSQALEGTLRYPLARQMQFNPTFLESPHFTAKMDPPRQLTMTSSTSSTSGVVTPTARNLLAPHNTFTKFDEEISQQQQQQHNPRGDVEFGSYHLDHNKRSSSLAPFVERRSDVLESSDSGSVEIVAIPAIQLQSDSNAPITIPKQVVPLENATLGETHRPNYAYIPLQQHHSLLSESPHTMRNHSVTFESETGANVMTSDVAEGTYKKDDLFAADAIDNPSRRIGFNFARYSLKPTTPFHPKSYREDSTLFDESIGFEQPFNEDGGSTIIFEPDTQHKRQLIFDTEASLGASRPIEFPGSTTISRPYTQNSAATSLIFRDEVTKFGDINGPITALPQRQQRGIHFTDMEFRTGPPRPFIPQKSLSEYLGSSDYKSSRKSRFYPFKSSRSPRVIFPSNDNIGTTGTTGVGSGVYFSDNVAFRDQNFGINDLAAIQDIRNEFSLQKIDATGENSPPANGPQSANTFKEKGCGISLAKQAAQRRIVGGDDAGFGSFPWQTYIRIGSSRCGGSLVSRRHVVTAGHCVARAAPRQVHVTLGDYVINSAVEPLPAYTFAVRRIDVHPYFKFTPQADRFDVSVLTLEKQVHFMPHIAPICLPEKNEDFLGKFGWAAGWGALNPGSRLRPKTLQAVDVPVIENRICEKWHRQNGINVVIYPEMMCAGYRNGGKDSCQGDSGGPLMHEKNGRWYLIGIVSAGYSCASRGQPGIYHRVPYTVDWISYVVGLTLNP